jgi:hypothetical protein
MRRCRDGTSGFGTLPRSGYQGCGKGLPSSVAYSPLFTLAKVESTFSLVSRLLPLIACA